MLKRYWLLAALPLVMLVGALFPAGGAAIRDAGWALPLLVAIVLFISGYTLEISHAVRQAMNFPAILLTLTSTYLLAPLLAYGLARLLAPTIGGADSAGFYFLQAVMIMASQAGPIATAIALTVMARGDHALALVLTLVSNALTILWTPLILRAAIGTVVAFPVGEMMSRLLLIILLPVIAGILLRRAAGPTILPPRLVLIAGLIPQCIVMIFVYIGFAAAAKHLAQDVTLAFRFAAVCLLLNALLLLTCSLIAKAIGLPLKSRIAIMFCGSQKTVPNGMYLWGAFFAANPYGAIPMVFYQIIQLAGGALLAPWLKNDENPSPENKT